VAVSVEQSELVKYAAKNALTVVVMAVLSNGNVSVGYDLLWLTEHDDIIGTRRNESGYVRIWYGRRENDPPQNLRLGRIQLHVVGFRSLTHADMRCCCAALLEG
jgi:hypothetical protein